MARTFAASAAERRADVQPRLDSMGTRHIVRGGTAAVAVALAACGVGEGTQEAEVDTHTSGAMAEQGTDSRSSEADPEATSDAAIGEFAAWYEAAAAEGGRDLPQRLRQTDETARREAYARFIRELCGMNAGDADSRRAAGAAIADNPEFGGDLEWARSAIGMARLACGLDK